MKIIEINAIPNQSFSARLSDARYEFTFKETRGVMAVTIIRDDIKLVDNTRIVAGAPLLPYKYQEQGNFFILTENEELPDYTQFGVTQSLVYLDATEMAVIDGTD